MRSIFDLLDCDEGYLKIQSQSYKDDAITDFIKSLKHSDSWVDESIHSGLKQCGDSFRLSSERHLFTVSIKIASKTTDGYNLKISRFIECRDCSHDECSWEDSLLEIMDGKKLIQLESLLTCKKCGHSWHR